MSLLRSLTHTIAIAVATSITITQTAAPGLDLSIGTAKAKVAAKYGKRFGVFGVFARDDDYNAAMGAPTGLWDVYHLTASGDRMYVTILHFTPQGPQFPDPTIDSLMLAPNGQWTVAQILSDQPQFASLCSKMCDVIRTTEKGGETSLQLQPQHSPPGTVILDFIGDSGTKWKSVVSMDSISLWVYELPLKSFESHHANSARVVIGTWSSTKKL